MQSVKALRRWLVIVALLRLLAGIGIVVARLLLQRRWYCTACTDHYLNWHCICSVSGLLQPYQISDQPV